MEGESFVYDSALTMIAFLVRGTPDDMRRAKVIGEAFVQLVNREPDGRIRDVYTVDDIYDMQPTWQGDGSGCGNMAWVINALIQYYERDPYQPFLDTALAIANFVENEYKGSLDDDIPGGYINGYAYYGGTLEKRTYKVTEHNITIYAAFMKLYSIMKENNMPGYEDWYDRAQWAKTFVTDQMWNAGWGMYLAGTTYEKVLDANTHAIMAFNDPVRNPQIVSWLENNTLMTHDGFTGFAFDDKRGGVWFEGTSYMAMVYQMLSQFPKSSLYLSEVERAQTTALGANGYGIVSACHHQVQTYFHELFSSPHIGATASYLCAAQGYNVLFARLHTASGAPVAYAGQDETIYFDGAPAAMGAESSGYGASALAGTAQESAASTANPITLDATKSYDYNNNPLIYDWTMSTPLGSSAELDDPTSPTPSFTPDVEGNYVFQLTISNGISEDYDSITITIIENYAPYIDRPIDDKQVFENEVLEFTVSASDVDGDTLTYSIEESPGYTFPAYAAIDSETGEFIWRPGFDGQGDYKVRVRVTDTRGGDDLEDINITVNDIPVTRVGPGQGHTDIQGAIDDPSSESIVYVYAGTYVENIILKGGKSLIGEAPHSAIPYPVVIEGNVICMESDSKIESVEIVYKEGPNVSFTNTHYDGLNVLADAGITAIDSQISVRNCIIMPETGGYGKGIQIWNMYGSADKIPKIENNLMLNADTGIYLFSQASGGAINAEIANNTFDNHKYGLVLRMRNENPVIQNNIITNSLSDAVHITYEAGALLNARRNNIIGNNFYGNTRDIYCDSLQSEILPLGAGNIYVDPQYSDPAMLDYTPLNSLCDGKGCVLE